MAKIIKCDICRREIISGITVDNSYYTVIFHINKPWLEDIRVKKHYCCDCFANLGETLRNKEASDD